MTRNQIDHFCVARKFRRSFNGVTISLTKILPVTTMHLPVAAMKLEVEKRNFGGRYNVKHLKDP